MSTHEFTADIKELMHLIVHAFYSNKDVFLRELVSNASDSLNKLRYQSLTDKTVLDSESSMEIRITTDKEAKTLTIEDTGLGMTKDDLVNNLGMIAKSGTKSFLDALKKNNENLIGQFGVGFYSAYLVADKVQVFTKHNNDKTYVWESDTSNYSITELDECDLKRGAKIVLHMKEDQLEYLEESKIKELIKKHSQFIDFPIMLYVEKEVEVEGETIVDEEKETNDEDEPVIDDVEIDDGDDKEVKKETEIIHEFEKINDVKPIWTRDAKDVTDEEYKSFYQSVTDDYGNYHAVKHFKVEGSSEFTGVLFIPESKPFDMFNTKKQNNIKIYVNRVFIMDDCKEIVPEWLSFVKGVIDCKDIPLNISREILQRSKLLNTIKKQIVKKSIEMIKELSGDDKKYNKFYENFSKNIKLGIHEDKSNKDKLIKYLRFHSTKSGLTQTSFDKYCENMKEGQENIYYITGESKDILEKSPFLEALTKRDYEVLFMTDPIDEYMVSQVTEFNDKKLVCCTKGDLKFNETDEEKKTKEETETSFKQLTEAMKTILGDKVESVRLSNRTVDSPCCLVSSEFGWSANMERIMKAQALGNDSMYMYMMARKSLEINPDNKVIQKLNLKVDLDNETFKNSVELLFDTASLTSGFTLKNPTEFAGRIYDNISVTLESVENMKEEVVEGENEIVEEEVEEEEVEEEEVDVTESENN